MREGRGSFSTSAAPIIRGGVSTLAISKQSEHDRRDRKQLRRPPMVFVLASSLASCCSSNSRGDRVRP